MSDPNESTRSRNIVTLVGLLLIVLGVLFLIGRMISVDVERLAWPFFVIVPGVLVFLFSLVRGNQAGERLAMVGSAVTMVLDRVEPLGSLMSVHSVQRVICAQHNYTTALSTTA